MSHAEHHFGAAVCGATVPGAKGSLGCLALRRWLQTVLGRTAAIIAGVAVLAGTRSGGA